MHRSELQQYSADEPIWGFVAQLGSERFTGQADVGSSPRVHLFVDEGHVYLAERDGDADLGSRLVARGAMSVEQLQRGAVHLGDLMSMARLFHRDPSIDRDVVEFALDAANEEVLTAVAGEPVGTVALYPLRHHPSGVHQWRSEPEAPAAPLSHDPEVAAVAAAVIVAATVEAPVEEPAPVIEETVPAVEAAAALPSFSSMFTPLAADEAEPVEAVAAPEPAAVPVTPTVLPTLGAVGTRIQPHPDGMPITPGVAQFDPKELEGLELPKLATKVMSVGEITAAHEAIKAEQAAAEARALDPGPDHDTSGIPSFEQLLETPAIDWSAPKDPPAAREIWDMVDEMLGLPHQDDQLVHAGAMNGTHPDDKKGRGWLRSRKG